MPFIIKFGDSWPYMNQKIFDNHINSLSQFEYALHIFGYAGDHL